MKTFLTTILVLIVTSLGIAQGSLDSGLVAFYPYNSNAEDESGNNNNCAVLGATLTTDRFGISDRAYFFDGSDDHMTISDNPILFSDSLTISWWYKVEDYNSVRVILSWVEGGGGYQQYFFGSQFNYFNGYDGSWYFNPSYTLNDLNVWKNVTVTYQKISPTSSTTSIFVDGEFKQTDNHSTSITYTPGYSFYIGRSYNGFDNFKGQLDDIRIYNRVLNSSEILALYNDSTTFSPPSVSSTYPHQNSTYFLPDETILIFFNETLDPTTINSGSVFVKGGLAGWYEIDPMYNSGNNSIEITPASPFKIGEEVTVSITNEILNTSGGMINPYVFSFKVKPYKGSARFVVADSLQFTFPPTQVTSADLNNDGLIDVVASNYDSSKVQISLNNGNGNFSPSQLIDGLFKPMYCALSDIDNDGDVDMVIPTNEQNKIQIYKNDGTGVFTNYSEININAPVAVCLGDFDGGGNTDFVAITNYGLFDSRAFTYKNDGQGNFIESGYESISFPVALRNIVGDIDNDGDLDIIGGTSDSFGAFKILTNDGNGNFSFVGGPYLGPHPDEIAGGDFDGDYDLDFVKCDWYQNGIGIAINNGLGEYPVENFLNLGNVGGQTRNPNIADFDGDGDQDFVSTFNSQLIQIVKNNGNLNFDISYSYPYPFITPSVRAITAADFDNNGSIDLVVSCTSPNQIIFYKNCLDSLVAYWSFDGNVLDYSGNLNHSISSTYYLAIDRYGIPQKAKAPGYLEGGNPGNNFPSGSSARSISCWISSAEQTGNEAIIDYGYSLNSNTHYALFMWDGSYASAGNESEYVLSDIDIGDDTWNFITSVYEGGSSGIHSIYVNGKHDTTAFMSSINTQLITRWTVGGFMSPGTLNASIDELKIFDFALTSQQIWEMYKATTTAPNLLFPGNDSTLINPTSTLVLDWDSTITATSYRLLISNDSLFNTVAYDTIVIVSSFVFDNWSAINFDNINWKVRTINDGGIGPWSETNRFNIILTDVEDETQLPTEFSLLQNYPNPFNPSTIIEFHLAKASNVELKVYDIIGNEIATLVSESKPAGVYKIPFSIDHNTGLSSGIYFYKITAGEFVQTRKMILIK